jgi:hypothetical protein
VRMPSFILGGLTTTRSDGLATVNAMARYLGTAAVNVLHVQLSTFPHIRGRAAGAGHNRPHNAERGLVTWVGGGREGAGSRG